MHREEKSIREHCRECDRVTEAEQTLTYATGMLVKDISVCVACGSILWDWTFGSTMTVAKEARAEIDGAQASKSKGHSSLSFE